MPKEYILKITGSVQGVFFRAKAKEIADKLNVTGYVKNEPGGSVTIVAQGNQKDIQKLENWSWQGSPGARVENVSKREHQTKLSYQDFTIEY